MNGLLVRGDSLTQAANGRKDGSQQSKRVCLAKGPVDEAVDPRLCVELEDVDMMWPFFFCLQQPLDW